MLLSEIGVAIREAQGEVVQAEEPLALAFDEPEREEEAPPRRRALPEPEPEAGGLVIRRGRGPRGERRLDVNSDDGQ
jgi:hypothetical protein